MQHRSPGWLAVAALLISCLAAMPTRSEDGDDGSFHPAEWLVIESVDRRGRRPFRPDHVFLKHLLDPTSAPPKAGDRVSGELGKEKAWTATQADEEGSVRLEKKRISYAYASWRSESERMVLADLRGGSALFVNGDGFAGNIYRFGFRGVPVRLRKGENHLYVAGTRGSFTLRFHPVDGPVVIGNWDVTRPSIVQGEGLDALGSVLVMNASDEWMVPTVEVGGGEVFEKKTRQAHGLAPLALAKLPFRARLRSKAAFPEDTKKVALAVSVDAMDTRTSSEVPFRVRKPDAPRRVTFRSWIDGSIQQYAVRRPRPVAGETPERGLVLSLHGAGVDCLGQARAYSNKDDFWHVAPTNRRKFGFDWQDWGRLDAYEALDHALGRAGVDRSRVYLSGHSMGGHGAWHLAANDADGFAAVAPSAGWVSFDSYGGRPDGALAGLWQAADAFSDTLALIDNLTQMPTFVLHGAKDDNVPVSEARTMIAAYRKVGVTPEYHFQENAKHWWNGDAAEGADCLDWPGIFELFRSARKPVAPAEISFTTVDPVIDSDHYWLRVQQPLNYGTAVRMNGAWKASSRSLHVKTENARTIRVAAPGGVRPDRLVVDGTRFDAPELPAWYIRNPTWLPLDGAPSWKQKGPQRSGPFKRAFDRRFVLVIPTRGDARENAEALARARYDAQVWWYRGNGNGWIVRDHDFVQGSYHGRNVILYGNADTNAAWDQVFDREGPIDVARGRLRIGDEEWKSDALGCVFVRPRKDDSQALAAAFGDTGVRGARIGYTLAVFVSGAGYPDYAAYEADVLLRGDGGVIAAGWFDHRWQLDGRGYRR